MELMRCLVWCVWIMGEFDRRVSELRLTFRRVIGLWYLNWMSSASRYSGSRFSRWFSHPWTNPQIQAANTCAAKSFGVRSPIPYKWRKFAAQHLRFGMNFAYGGTGVFNTLVPYPNMTAQIGLLEQLIKDKTFSMGDVNSSVALVMLSGNDYFAYNARNGTAQVSFLDCLPVSLLY